MFSIEAEQEYRDERNEEWYGVVFANDDIVVLRDRARNHRLTKRDLFENRLEEGFWEPKNEAEKVVQTEAVESHTDDAQEVPFEDIAWVGEKSASSLRSEGFATAEDIRKGSDEALLNCKSVGETAVENIRNWVEENA